MRAGFDAAAAKLGSTLDPEQRPAADRLAALGAALGRRPRFRRRSARGVYLHGPVGRGKTWLVDTLLDQLPADGIRRLHAFEAAQLLRRGVARHAGRPRAVHRAVDAILDGVRLLFLDELHAHDPGDAMLLYRLVSALPEHRTLLVATSNYSPEGLLPDPVFHELVRPLITAIEQTCDVLEVAGPVDHRAAGHGGARPHWCSGAWVCPGSSAQLHRLGLRTPDPGSRKRLRVAGRELWALAADDQHVHVAFEDLCEGRTSTTDLLELADRYRTLVLAGVRPLSGATADARRRFANLVDVCWDRDVRLVVLATGSADEILDEDLIDRDRMVSRLRLLRAA